MKDKRRILSLLHDRRLLRTAKWFSTPDIPVTLTTVHGQESCE